MNAYIFSLAVIGAIVVAFSFYVAVVLTWEALVKRGKAWQNKSK